MSKVAGILIAAGMLIGLAVYTAWINGLFLRCPHCGKIGSWRFDPAGAPTEEKDEEGVAAHSTQLRTCRKCKELVLERWSDRGGRTLDRHSGTDDPDV